MTIKDLYNDSELLALLAQDNRHAFDLLYRRYWLQLYDAAYQRLRNSQQSEDIVQEIFISIWIRRAELHIDNLQAYLRAAVRFRVLNFVERDLVAETFFEPFETIATHASGADEQLLEKEMISLLNRYIKTLPEKRRRIFVMHIRENLTTKEIAEQLRISQKTVQNQLGSALQALRTHVLPMLVFFVFDVLI